LPSPSAQDDPALRERRTAGLPAHVRKSADQSSGGRRESSDGGRRKSSTGGALIPQLKVQGTMRTMANAGEACSVVVWGWPAGDPMPPEVIACMEVVTKNPPWAILQPRACAESNRLFVKMSRLAARLESLAAREAKAKAAERGASAEGGKGGEGEGEGEGEGGAAGGAAGGTAGGTAAKRASKLAVQIAACKQEMADLSEHAEHLSRTAALLPLAFVTFESVMMARRVINAARSSVLFTAAAERGRAIIRRLLRLRRLRLRHLRLHRLLLLRAFAAARQCCGDTRFKRERAQFDNQSGCLGQLEASRGIEAPRGSDPSTGSID
jgi:hypothetical protein